MPSFLLLILIWIAMGAGSCVGGFHADLSLPFLAGFLLAVVTTIVAKVRRRTAGRILVRIGLGALLGAVAAAIAHPLDAMGGHASYPLVLGSSLLVWPWGAQRDSEPVPGSEAQQAARRRRAWDLPFMLTFGQTIGTAVGSSLAAGPALERDPVGSALALLSIAVAVVTLVLSVVTVGCIALLRRPPSERLGLRAGLSVLSGGLIGALSWGLRSDDIAYVPVAALILATIGLSVPWSGRANAQPTATAK